MVYWTSNDNKNKTKNTMKKVYEYITITMSVIGLMSMIGVCCGGSMT